MRTTWTLLFLTITTWVYSQSMNVEFFQSFDSIQTTTELASIKGKIRFEVEYRESLNLGIEHINWLAYKGRKTNGIRLITLSLGGRIFYQEFFRKKPNKETFGFDYEKLYSHEDIEVLNRLNDYALKKLGNKIDFEHIEKVRERSTFGYACYVSASMPTDGEKMLEFVSNKDTVELTKWLKSINPVKQTYSYLGFKLLESKGEIRMTSDIEELLTNIENNETPIYTCAGCTTWEYSQIKNILTKENVEKFIDRNN
jgi:hypothetical protein